MPTTKQQLELMRLAAIEASTVAVIDTTNDKLFLYDDSGNLVGTIAPDGLATITANNNEVLTGDGAGNGIGQPEFTIDANGHVVVQNTSDSITAFHIKNSAASSKLTVDTLNGRVGINKAAPVAELDVTGGIICSGKLGVGVAAQQNFGLTVRATPGAQPVFEMQKDDGTVTTQWGSKLASPHDVFFDAEFSGAGLGFRTRVNNERMYIASTGEVRFGTTTSPSANAGPSQQVFGHTGSSLPTLGATTCAIVGQTINGVTLTVAIDSAQNHAHLIPQVQTLTLGAAATTFAATANTVKLTGDAGGNTLATITGNFAYAGSDLTIIHQDANVTYTDTAATTANTINTAGGLAPAAQYTVVTLVHDGTKWYEKSRSVN